VCFGAWACVLCVLCVLGCGRGRVFFVCFVCFWAWAWALAWACVLCVLCVFFVCFLCVFCVFFVCFLCVLCVYSVLKVFWGISACWNGYERASSLIITFLASKMMILGQFMLCKQIPRAKQ